MSGCVAGPRLADVPLALLVGGLGTRMRQVSERTPKAMFEVAGRPFIAHVLELLQWKGVQRVVFCTGYLGEQIEAYVGDGSRFGLQVTYSREGDHLLGTGGALKLAAPLLDETFWVMYGDTYLDVDFGAILQAFRDSSARGLMTVFRNENRLDRSNVVFRDGRLLAYDKRVWRQEMTHIDYGLGLLRRAALDLMPDGEPSDLADLYGALVARGALAAFEVRRRFYEIGSPQGLAETRAFFEQEEPGVSS
jgi:MurNAc alpha-1-phosphate uridylyltransferase